MIGRELHELAWQRAAGRCEYCRLPQEYERTTHQVDHVIAIFHRGPTIASNLALACLACNGYKGTNVAGVDPATKRIIRLFHPRRHKWAKHFVWDGPRLVGRTDIGRTTIVTLRINLFIYVDQRRELIAEGVFPPDERPVARAVPP